MLYEGLDQGHFCVTRENERNCGQSNKRKEITRKEYNLATFDVECMHYAKYEQSLLGQMVC